MLPKISIITPSFNQVDFIERTIQSVLKQNYPNLEYLIIDGGSNDGTLDIIKKYSNCITYWVSEPDHGQSYALNKGFRIATGDLIGWLNSDDMYCSETLNTVAECMGLSADCDACFGGIFIIDEKDSITNAIWPVDPVPEYNLLVGLNVHQQALFWRRDVFSRIGMLDENLDFAMDLDFIMRLLLNCRMARIRRQLGMFRIHSSAKTSMIKNTGEEEYRLILKRYIHSFKSHYGTLPGKVDLRIRHLLSVVDDAPVTYLFFKLQSIFKKSLKPNWQNV